jgi:hypothetical protein
MKIARIKQNSPEWFELRRGKIGGTIFGQVISGRKNALLFDLLNERLSPWIDYTDEYISDDMQFGKDNEPIARELYIKESGIEFGEVGCILSDYSGIHLASPDGLNEPGGIVLEIKCTQNGAKHLKRFFEGVESDHLPQIKNYFAVSDEVKAVHWVSYCPDRFERPLVVYIFTREMFAQDEIDKWRSEIRNIEAKLNVMEQSFTF